MNRLRASPLNIALALLGAVLLVFIFPDFNAVWLAPFALAPLLIAVSREPRPWARFLLGWTAGVLYWFILCGWIQFVLEFHGGMGHWGGWGTFLLFCVLKAIHLGVFAMLAAILLPHRAAVLTVPAIWTGIERTHGTFGFAWLALGNAGIDMPLALRLAPFTGVYGLSFFFAALSTALALVILRRSRKELVWLAVLAVAIALPAIPPPEPPDESAVVVQPNLSEDREWTPVTADLMHEHLVDISLRAALRASTRLIIWPEAPGPFYYYRDPRFHEQADKLAQQTQSYFLFGTVAHTPRGAPLNSAVMLRPDGSVVDRYDKINLVPFGEFVPPLFDFVNRVTQEAGDFVPGTRRVLFDVAGHRVGAFICYESAFPNDVRRFTNDGAELLVNISNDGYFGHSAARAQHLMLVRMRAVENRRWILRATNDGISASVDPGGRIVQRFPMYAEHVGRMEFSYTGSKTIYARTGDWFAWSCLAAGIAACLLAQRPHYTPPQRKT